LYINYVYVRTKNAFKKNKTKNKLLEFNEKLNSKNNRI